MSSAHENLPFQILKNTPEIQERSFKANVQQKELQWHRDREDRLVQKISGEGWLLQLDNEMPLPIEGLHSYMIPAGIWHRIIKLPHATDLIVQIHMRHKEEMNE